MDINIGFTEVIKNLDIEVIAVKNLGKHIKLLLEIYKFRLIQGTL